MAKIIAQGNAGIPKSRQNFVIGLIGQSFENYFYAFRQYIDNSKDSIIKKEKYDKNFSDSSKTIIVWIDRSKKSFRIIDHGLSITPQYPIWETPSGEEIILKKEKIPYINSFQNMAENLLNSFKRFEDYQSGQNASGMLGFIKLGAKAVKFISKTPDGKIYTYTLNEDAYYTIEEGGEKLDDDEGTDVLIENIDERIFKNWFNENRLRDLLQRTYHQDILSDTININLIFDAEKKNNKGRNLRIPFIKIEPLMVTGDLFEITQTKTEKNDIINLDLRLSNVPRTYPFVVINCNGTGGVPVERVLDNAIWKNDYLQGFINADFLNFSNNDKSTFIQDEKLSDFQKIIEEKVEPLLAKKINEIRARNSAERMDKLLNNLKYALSRALKKIKLDLNSFEDHKKKCPKCESLLSYNVQKCPNCGFEFPEHTKECKFCNKEIPSASKVCPNCGKDLLNYIACPHCNKQIPALSFNCPECGKKLRDRNDPPGKIPNISFQKMGVYQKRSAIDKEGERLVVIKINNEHKDYLDALNGKYEYLYLIILIAREITKFKFGEGNVDYTEDLISVLLNTFNELTFTGTIKYKED